MRLEVKINKVLHTDSKSSYRIFKARILNVEKYEEGEERHKRAIQRVMTFKGNMTYCVPNDTYIINAKIDRDKYGVVFKIESAILKKIELESELQRYMEKHIKGVGAKTATTIMDALGVKAIDTIKSEQGVEELVKILGEKKRVLCERIRSNVLYNANIFAIMEFLQLHNLPVNIAGRILDEYGNEGLIELKSNPYLFVRCVKFEELDAIASKYHFLDAKNINRLSAGVVAIVNNNTSVKGDVYTHISDVYTNLQSFLNNNGCYESITLSNEEIYDAIVYALEKNLISAENEEFLYITYLRNKENDIAYNIRRLNKHCKKLSTKEIEKHIDEYEKEKNVKASPEQREAVIKALQNDFSILTGLPGAGKTFCINLIVKIFQKLYPEAIIRPIAPTGKASNRMSEMTGIKAETIHRALKINEFTGKVDELEADFVIIDEASMMDIYLAGTLFSNIKDNTKVLIVGDIEQLPSVGAGVVLKDIIESKVAPVTKLTKLFRQAEGSSIVTNAHAIAYRTYDFKFDAKCCFWESNTTEIILSRILTSYNKLLQRGYSRESICILTPVNGGALGTIELNRLIQANFNQTGKAISINDTGDIMKEGDLVIQTENDYDLNVFNGETGKIIKIEDKKDDLGDVITTANGKKDFLITVDFNGRFIKYDRELVKNLNLAYCITIHKSQGSEYSAIINVIDQSHELMLNRNLIYTAWTRAKEQLVILGNKDAFNKAVRKEDAINRLSNLQAKLNKEEFNKTYTVKKYENKPTSLEMKFTEFIDLDYSDVKILGYDEDGDVIF